MDDVKLKSVHKVQCLGIRRERKIETDLNNKREEANKIGYLIN